MLRRAVESRRESTLARVEEFRAEREKEERRVRRVAQKPHRLPAASGGSGAASKKMSAELPATVTTFSRTGCSAIELSAAGSIPAVDYLTYVRVAPVTPIGLIAVLEYIERKHGFPYLQAFTAEFTSSPEPADDERAAYLARFGDGTQPVLLVPPAHHNI